jgi:thiamine transport system permease protein
MSPRGRARAARWCLAAIPIGFLAVFFVWPVGSILLRGLRPDGEWDVGAFREVLGQERIQRIIWFTLWQAVASTVLTLVVALPGAYVLARVRFRGRSLVRAAVTVPFVLPTVVVASAFLGIAGPRGVFTAAGDLRGTVWAILLAHLFFNYAVVIRVVGGLWSHLDPALEDAARTLGATRWRAFREVTWPLLRPAIVSAASIVFLFCFTSFGVIVLLGGLDHSTVEAEIYRSAVTRLDLKTASVLAVVQLVTVVTLLLVFTRSTERRTAGRRLLAAADVARPPASVGERAFLTLNLLAMAVLLGGPLAVLVERSLHTEHGYGLDWYRALSSIPARSALFVAPMDAIRSSLAIACVATIVAVTVGSCAAFVVAGRGRSTRATRGLDLFVMLPLGTSAVTVGFGFLIALDRPPVDLRASWWIVPLAHALVAIPFVVRIVVPVLRAIDPRLREAAALLGAAPRRVTREIDVPIVRRAVLVAAGFAFAISLGEFGATAFIARADSPTVPTAIFRSLSQPGAANFGAAMAMSTILMVLTGAAILLIERVRVPGADAF